MADFHVRASWDPDAGVWWAESDDLFGMVAEAESYEKLVEDILAVAAELIPMNHPNAASFNPNRPGSHRITISQEVETVAFA